MVHGHGGMDEISLSGPSTLSELKDGKVTTRKVSPEEFGLKQQSAGEIAGGDAPRNAGIILDILDGRPGAYRDAVLLNAGAAISAFHREMEIGEGVDLAAEAIDNGTAAGKLDALVKVSNGGKA